MVDHCFHGGIYKPARPTPGTFFTPFLCIVYVKMNLQIGLNLSKTRLSSVDLVELPIQVRLPDTSHFKTSFSTARNFTTD